MLGTRLRLVPASGPRRLSPPRLPRVRRDWHPVNQAAALLGLSSSTLRRRMEKPYWVEGAHYRWVVRSTRRTLEVNVPKAAKLLDHWGWG